VRRQLAALHQQLKGQRQTFRGTFERFGIRWDSGGAVTTALLRDIHDERSEYLCGHAWFDLTPALDALDLCAGDVVQFRAKVQVYTKGYQGCRADVRKRVERDYKFSRPSRLLKVAAGEVKTHESVAYCR
jgi:hypothetical protein